MQPSFPSHHLEDDRSSTLWYVQFEVYQGDEVVMEMASSSSNVSTQVDETLACLGHTDTLPEIAIYAVDIARTSSLHGKCSVLYAYAENMRELVWVRVRSRISISWIWLQLRLLQGQVPLTLPMERERDTLQDITGLLMSSALLTSWVLFAIAIAIAVCTLAPLNTYQKVSIV